MVNGVGHLYTAGAPEPVKATAYYATLNVVAREVQHFTLQLTRARNGAPVSGLPVKFYANGNRWLLCTTVTDADGFAECNAPLPGPPTLALLLLTGYEGVFTGNAAYLPASATASVGLY